MKYIFFLIAMIYCITANSQYEDRIIMNPKYDKTKQWIIISGNGKKLLSDEPIKSYRHRKEVVGKYKAVQLQEVVDSIRYQVRAEISDSIATVGGGGGAALPYYEIIFRGKYVADSSEWVIDSIINNTFPCTGIFRGDGGDPSGGFFVNLYGCDETVNTLPQYGISFGINHYELIGGSVFYYFNTVASKNIPVFVNYEPTAIENYIYVSLMDAQGDPPQSYIFGEDNAPITFQIKYYYQ